MEINSILEFPTEILVKILSYIQQRCYLPLVCHRFYEIICLLERNLYKIKISESMLLDSFEAIINSKRVINEAFIQFSSSPTQIYLNQVEEIFIKFNIEYLTLSSMSKVNPIFNSTLPRILRRIPKDNIKELEIIQLDQIVLLPFIENQTNSLRNLKVTGYIEDQNLFKNLKLSHLTLTSPKCKLRKIISSQSNLKYLKIIGDEIATIDLEVMEEILKIDSLEVLDIPLIEETEINHLNNVKSFSFRSNSHFIYSFCNSVNFQNLEEIDMSCPEETLNMNLFIKISQNFPKLMSLSIRSPMSLTYLSLIISRLKFLNSLLIENLSYTFVGIAQLSNEGSNDSNLNLKKLTIINHDRKVLICSNDLFKIIRSTPKLQYLTLSGHIDTQKLFKNILQTCASLKEIVIKAPNWLSTTYIMYVIKEYGTDLNLIILEDFKTAREIESLKTFFEDEFSHIQKIESKLILRKRTRLELFEIV